MDRKLKVSAFLAAVVLVGAVLGIELGNRTAIGPLQMTQHYPCADSDAMPYSARCIEFMMGPRPGNRPEAAN